jgi:hypothetical protein
MMGDDSAEVGHELIFSPSTSAKGATPFKETPLT